MNMRDTEVKSKMQTKLQKLHFNQDFNQHVSSAIKRRQFPNNFSEPFEQVVASIVALVGFDWPRAFVKSHCNSSESPS